MAPKQFLAIDGMILVMLGLAGFIVGERSLFGGAWSLDTAEDIVHTGAGAVTLAAAYVLSASRQRWLVLLIGLTDVLFAALGFALRDRPVPNLLITNLDHPGDNLLHFALGIWGLVVAGWSLRGRDKAAIVTGPPSR
jgi:hypothetical protein